MELNYAFTTNQTTYDPSQLTEQLVLNKRIALLNNSALKEQEEVNNDDSLSADEKDSKIAMILLATGLSASLLTKSNDANAIMGEEWAAFDATFATLMASIKVLAGKIADSAVDTAIEIYEQQSSQLGEMFGIVNSEQKSRGSMERAAAIAIADDKRASERELSNKRIVVANQAPPSACIAESLAYFLSNQYPKLKARSVNTLHLNLNNLVRKGKSKLLNPSQGNEGENNEEFAKITRGRYPKDEHLLGEIFGATLSSKELKKQHDRMSAQLLSLRGKMAGKPTDKLVSERLIKEESNRVPLVAAMSLVVKTRQDILDRKTGMKGDDIKAQIQSLKTSKDKRDNLLAKGLKSVFNLHSVDGNLSFMGRLRMELDFRGHPDYKEYLNRLGASPTPFLKEILAQKRIDAEIQNTINDEREKTLHLLSFINQLKLQKKVGV